MSWVMVWVGAAFAGVVVIGACAIKVFVAVRGLGREIDRTRARLEPERARLAGEFGRLGRLGE